MQQISVIGYSATYQGYVKEVDGDPIVSAIVGLYSGGLIDQDSTDANGYYEFSTTTSRGFPYFLKASKNGFVTKQILVSYQGGTYNFALKSIETTYDGNLYDETESNAPIEGARVRLYSPNYQTVLDTDYTDSNGEYDLSFTTGSYSSAKLHVTYEDSYIYDETVEIGGYFELDLYLNPVVKYAVIVGISDYKAIGDLSVCDEDATDWYNHFVTDLNWDSDNIEVYGDGHSGDYPKYSGLATEYNVNQALDWLVSVADDSDIIAFIFSGHGSGDGKGSSYLCMWDCLGGEDGEDGNLYDTELDTILEASSADKIFILLDSCYSGGFGSELMSIDNSIHVYLTTTCTENGLGYEDPELQNSCWIYYFLDYSWQDEYESDVYASMEDVFDYAHDNYDYIGKDEKLDEPQEFDGNPGVSFYLV